MVHTHGPIADVALFLFAVMAGSAGFDRFRQNGATYAESGAYGVFAVLMVLSWAAQVAALSGWTAAYPAVLAAVFLLCTIHLVVHRSRFLVHIRSIYGFFSKHRLIATGMLAAWAYILGAGLMGMRGGGAPTSEFWQLMQHHPGGLLRNGAYPVPVLNHLIFSAPWQPALCAPLSRLLAYMVIAFGTYSLARRYAWPPMAVTVSLLVAGMPRLVSQAVAGGNELTAAAAALISILALYRLVEKPSTLDLVVLLSATAFTVDGGTLCYLMAFVMTALSGFLFVRRHGMNWLRQANRLPAIHLLIGLSVLTVFLQPGVVAANLVQGHAWIGEIPGQGFSFNAQPLLGTLGNMARYLLLSIDLPRWVDPLLHHLFGFKLSAVLDLLYRHAVTALLDTAGAAADFKGIAGSGEGPDWFGLVGCFLVLPAVGYSLWRGPRRLRATALAILVYWVLVSLIVAWQPQNVRWMTTGFVCSGFFVAFFLPPWRIGHRGRLFLQVLGILQIVFVLLA